MPDILRFLRRRKWAVRVEMLRLGQLIRYRRFSNRNLPIVFGNAMPKSGSHIISQFLEGLGNFTPLVYTDVHPIRTYTVEGRYRSPEEILADIKRLKHGDIGWGYLRATEVNIEAITQPDMVTYFAYRDPRDVIVSHILYAMTIHEGHRMRPFYQSLPSMDERVRATIAGVEDERYSYPDIRTDYERYLPFLEQPGVMAVRFEDLIYKREETLDSMMDELERKGLKLAIDRENARAILNKSMAPSRSPTFRSGKSGSWREHFSQDNKGLFKEIAGDLLIRLGYEDTNDW